MSPPDRSRRRLLSKDERVLWATFTKAIEPLRDRMLGEDSDADADETAVPPERPRQMKSPPVAPKSEARLSPKQLPLAPLGRRGKQRIARGRDAIEAHLDLHGLTQSEAHGELLRFLRIASARAAKLVLVITGKSGVLRQQVPQWLGLPEFRGYVTGFETAGKTHGGEGALYVRVRRAK